MGAFELTSVLRSRLCPTLTSQEAQHITDATVPGRMPAEGRICHEGDRGGGLIFLIHGTADILKDDTHHTPQVLATVVAPIMLGEISLLTGEPSSATVRARSECEFYVLTRPQYERLLETESRAVYKLIGAIAQILARRLVGMNEKVVTLSSP